MNTPRCIYVTLLVAALAAGRCGAAETAAAVPPPPAPTCRVVVVGGLPGSPVMARRFTDWTARFRTWCVEKAGVPAANVVVLSGDAGAKPEPSSADAVLKAVAEVADRTTPADQFVLFLVGHGDNVDGEAAFALPGRNLGAFELRAALARVPAQRQVVLHFGASSGDMVALLAANNRVVVAATAPGEIADPVFAEFFLRDLEQRPPAEASSLLDVYNRAAHETARWIRRLNQTESGTWHVDGKQSIALFHKLCDGPADAPGARLLDASSKPIEPEPDVPLVTPPDQATAEQQRIPANIRVVAEHATLADTGRETGVAAVAEKGFVAVPVGGEGEPGFLAARTVLGKP